jgi:hypothetical protein
MKEEILEVLKGSTLDTLRLFAALFSAPFVIGKEFITRPMGEPFHWPPQERRTSRTDVE